jgi:hypothetical protein
MRRRTAVALSSAALCGVVLTGCGGSSVKDQPAAAASPTATVPATASATPTTSVGAKVPAAALAARVQGAIRTAGNVQIGISESSSRGTGVLDVRTSALKASLTIKDGSDVIKAVVLPGVMYLNSGEVVAGKHWVKLAGTLHAAQLKTARANIIGGVAVVSPGLMAGSWRSAGAFSTGATTVIGGENTTEYAATVPKAAFLAAFPAEARRTMKLSGDTKVRVWLNAQSLPLKIEIVTAYTDGDETDTTTYSKWGHARAIALPPSRDVLASSKF